MRILSRQLLIDKIIYVFVFTLPISSFLSARLLVLLVAFSLIQSRNYRFMAQTMFSLSWDILIYISILGAGLLYSEDIPTGLKVLETSFGFLAIPIMLSLRSLVNEDRLYKILLFFALGLLTACIICLANAIILYVNSGDIVVFLSYHLSDIIDSHPTYLAYYLIFAITFGLYLLFSSKGQFTPIIMVPILFFFFLMLMLTGGQTSFISMLFIFSFFVLKFLIEARSARKSIAFGLVCIMVISMFLFNSVDQKSRNSVLNDSWERFVLWESAIDAIPNVVTGIGTGDYKTILNSYYLSHGLTRYANDSYNAHNQFIQILLTNGLLGLLSVVILISRPLYLSVKNNNILGILIFFPFIIYGMTEVFLGRYQGVVFFALIHQVFISHYASLKPSIAPLKGV